MLVLGGYAFYEIIMDFSNQWWWLVIAIIYTTTIGELFGHRIMGHRLFPIDPKRWTYKILCWLSSVDFSYGPAWGSALWHRAHHLYSDQGPADNLNWRYYWYSSATLMPFPQLHDPTPPDVEKYVENQRKFHATTLNDPWTYWCDKHSVFISISTMVFLWFVAPVLLIKVICLGRLLIVGMALNGGLTGHIKNFPLSYRNYNTPDTTSNNILFHYLWLGFATAVLQNNHHGNPQALRPNPRWFEIDSAYPILLLVKYLIEPRPKSNTV